MPDAATLPSDLTQYGVPGVTIQPQPQMGPVRSVTVPQPAQAQPPQPAPQAPAQLPQSAPQAPAQLPQSAPQTPPVTPAAPPSPLAKVRAVVSAGESGGGDPYHETYGGGHFGWDGVPNTGSGKYGFVKSTWGTAAKQWMAANPGQPPPNFAVDADQDKVFDFWASKTYREKTGRELAPDAAANKVDWSALADQWPSLQKKANLAGSVPDVQAYLKKSDAAQKSASEMAAAFMKEAEKAPPGSQKREQAMQQAMEHSERLSKEFEDMAAHPPTATVTDALQNFGSLASVIGIFGGLLSRRPLTAALGAAGAAMKAKNENNDEQFNRAYKVWHDQTSLVSQALTFQNQEITQIMADERLSESERQDQLTNKFRAFGMVNQANASAIGDLATVYTMQNSLNKATRDWQLQQAQITAAYARANKDNMGGAAGGAGKDQAFTRVDKEGNPTGEPFMAHRSAGGGYVSAEDNTPIEVGADEHIMPFKQDSGRLQQQQQRMIGAGNTAEFYLHNVSRLPITASRGWFMGVENHTPEGLTDAIKRNFARTLTSYETKEMQSSAAGLGRVFGMLETQGGLQGMQTYGSMIESALTPQVNDPPLMTMRRMAEMRGIIERAAEAGAAQTKDSKVTGFLAKVAEGAKNSVPYTMDDVTDLEDAIRKRGGSPADVVASGKADESIREFSAKVLKNLGGDHPDRTQNGVLYTWKDGGYQPVSRAQ